MKQRNRDRSRILERHRRLLAELNDVSRHRMVDPELKRMLEEIRAEEKEVDQIEAPGCDGGSTLST